MSNEGHITRSLEPAKKTRKHKSTHNVLVEIVSGGSGVVSYNVLPLPESLKPGADKKAQNILRAVEKAVGAGDTSYLNKQLTVISVPDGPGLRANPVVTKPTFKLA